METKSDRERVRVENAQVYHERINKFDKTWIEIQSCKASAYAHFGEEVVKSLDEILNVVHQLRVYSNALAEDDGSDQENSREIRKILTHSRATGEMDETGAKVDRAISKLEEALKPLLTESASQTEKAIKEIAKAALESTITVTVPWPLNRLIP